MQTDNKGKHYDEYANSHPLENASGNSGSAGNNAAASRYLATLERGFKNEGGSVANFGRNGGTAASKDRWKTVTSQSNKGGFAYLAAQKDNLKKHWIAGDSKEFTEVTRVATEAAEAEDALCRSEGTGKLDAKNFDHTTHTFGDKIKDLQTKCCEYMIERFSSRAKRKTTSGELRMVWVYYLEKMAEKGVDNPDNKKVQAAYSRVPIQGWESFNFQDWLSQAKVQNRRNNRAIYELTREVATQDAMLSMCQFVNIPFENWYLKRKHRMFIRIEGNKKLSCTIDVDHARKNGEVIEINDQIKLVLSFSHRYYRREGDDIIYYLHDNEVNKESRDNVRHPDGTSFGYASGDFSTDNSISGYPEIHIENYGFTNPVTGKKGRFIIRKIPNTATVGNDTIYCRPDTTKNTTDDTKYGCDEKIMPVIWINKQENKWKYDETKDKEYISNKTYTNPTTGKTGRLIIRWGSNYPTKEHEIVRLRRENNVEYLSYTQPQIVKTITDMKTKCPELREKAQNLQKDADEVFKKEGRPTPKSKTPQQAKAEMTENNAKTCEFIANLLERTAEELREKLDEKLRKNQKDNAAISKITNNIVPKLESAYNECMVSKFSEAREIGQQVFYMLEKL